MVANRPYEWRSPRTPRGLILVLTPLAGLGGVLALIGYATGGGGLLAGAMLCLVGMLLYVGIYALDANASEMVVLQVPGAALLYSRIDSAMEMSLGYGGIKEAVEGKVKKQFKGQFTTKRTFVVSCLQSADTWLFLGGDLRLQLVQGLGKTILRVEWLTRDAKQAARRLKKAMSEIDYVKAAASSRTLAKCKRCGFVKPKKGSWTCPNCNLLLEGPDPAYKY